MKTLTNLFFLLLFAAGTCPDTSYAQGQKEVKLDPDATLIRGAYLQMATSTGMTVRWRTASNERSKVSYGTSPDKLDEEVVDSTLVTEHIVRLNNLKPYTKYYYAISTFKFPLQAGSNNYFYTLPEPGKTGKYRIAAFGDCGTNSANQRNVRNALVKYLGTDYLNAMILLGDNAYSTGTDAEYQAKFFNVYKEDLLNKYPLFPSPGNHDYYDMRNAGKNDQYKIAYFQNFTVPMQGESGGLPSGNAAYYSFDVGNVHFISLDSYGKDEKGRQMSALDGAQVEWVKKDLAANKNKGWIVAYWHHPPYTMGSHDSDKESDLVSIREKFIGILEDSGVDLILNGHSHVYERSKMMKGHYGPEDTFDPLKHNLSASTGLYDGSKNSAPYLKSDAVTDGTVYVVSGSAGQLGGQKAKYPHNAMYYSDNKVGGALMLEVEGNQLDVKWVCADGEIRDKFTMMKNVSKKDEKVLKADKILSKK